MHKILKKLINQHWGGGHILAKIVALEGLNVWILASKERNQNKFIQQYKRL